MNHRERNSLSVYIKDYLKKYYKDFINEKKLFKCPTCGHKETAQLLYNYITCFEPTCKTKLDIFDTVRAVQPHLVDFSDDDIKDYLKKSLNIKIEDNIDHLFEMYHKNDWACIPLAPGTKIPPAEFKWKDNIYKDMTIWKDWDDRKYNLALRTGEVSNIVVVDFDDDATYDKFKDKVGLTLNQKTKRGFQFIYKYNSAFFKTLNKVLRDDGYEMELRTDGAYCVIPPSIVDGFSRYWNINPIIEMPKDLKDFFMSYYVKENKAPEVKDDIQKVIDSGELDQVDLSHKRNDTFVKLAGIFRKKLNLDQTEYVLNIISNNLIDKPIESRELRAILSQIKKYTTYDKTELSKIILDRFEIIKEGTAFQIAKSLNFEQKDIEEVLNYLEKENKIINVGHNRFKRLDQVEWTTGYDDFSIPIDFEVPYFSEFARFDVGNMILIGGKTGTGKTTITGNFIKKFQEQMNLKSIDLITTEAGSKIGKVLEVLKVPPEFVCRPKTLYKHPAEIELRDDRITIIDWLKPTDGDFSQMGNTMEHFHNQMKKHRGFIIVFVQIRNDDKGTFFAQDQIADYVALSAKFLYSGTDNLNPYFQTTKIRDSRTNQQYMTIPLIFNPTTKILDRKK